MKKLLSILLCAVMLFSLAAFSAAETPETGFGAYEHVIIVGVDGGGAAFGLTDTPCFDSIFGRFSYTHAARAETVTLSAQNWGSILTGVDYTVHGFTNGSIEANERDSATGSNTLFYYVKNAFPEAELASFVNWVPINYGLIENDLGVKKYGFLNNDPGVTESVETYFAAGNAPKLLFIQLDNPDHMAHAHGGFSEDYYAAVREADAQIGRIYNAVAAQGLMENTLFIVVADHGETAGGHGGQTPEELSVVLAAIGRTVNRTQLNDVRNRDVAAAALYALGIEQPAHFTATVPAELFGANRGLSTLPTAVPETEPEEPATEPETEPPTEPVTEPATEPVTEPDGGTVKLDFWQRILDFFQKIVAFFRRLFGLAG